MKRYIRLAPRQLQVGEIVVTGSWAQADVTLADLERLAAIGQVEIALGAPTDVPSIAQPILAADLAAAVTAGSLDIGSLYFVTDTGKLALATAVNGTVTFSPDE
jgi:hypothetical protein